jgi:hypothetical protein
MSENWKTLWAALKADRYIFAAFAVGLVVGAALF